MTSADSESLSFGKKTFETAKKLTPKSNKKGANGKSFAPFFIAYFLTLKLSLLCKIGSKFALLTAIDKSNFVMLHLKHMAESLFVPKTSDRKKIYDEIAPQIAALVEGETDLVANLANVTAALKEAFSFFWIGFYIKKENGLVLSAFQGPVACTRIDFDKGVCGHCYTTRKIVIVPNVDEFPGHIACSSASKSEIVLPVFDKGGNVAMVLDIDSDQLDDFSETDARGLQKIVAIVEKLI